MLSSFRNDSKLTCWRSMNKPRSMFHELSGAQRSAGVAWALWEVCFLTEVRLWWWLLLSLALSHSCPLPISLLSHQSPFSSFCLQMTSGVADWNTSDTDDLLKRPQEHGSVEISAESCFSCHTQIHHYICILSFQKPFSLAWLCGVSNDYRTAVDYSGPGYGLQWRFNAYMGSYFVPLSPKKAPQEPCASAA